MRDDTDIDLGRVEETMAQDEPSLDAHEREQRAEAGKPAYLDLTAAELNRIAVEEYRAQNQLRGPIIIPEWKNAGIWCRRLTYEEQIELIQVNAEKGPLGAFCFRALNSEGERIFSNMKMYESAMKTMWNYSVIDRVLGEMNRLCKTQLTDKELGNS